MSLERAGSFALVLSLACAAPRIAAGQASEDETERAQDFDEASLFLDPSRTPWVLDDGVGTDEVPWHDFDPERSYLPFGTVHVGAHVRIAALPGGTPPQQDGPLLELGGFVDIRYAPQGPWRLRLALALSYQPNESQYLGGGATLASSAAALRFRIQPLAFDIGQWIVVRAGGDLGMQWSPSDPVGGVRTDFFGAVTGDIVGSFFGGTVEAGVTGGLQFTAITHTTRGYDWLNMPAEGVIGVTFAYLAP